MFPANIQIFINCPLYIDVNACQPDIGWLLLETIIYGSGAGLFK